MQIQLTLDLFVDGENVELRDCRVLSEEPDTQITITASGKASEAPREAAAPDKDMEATKVYPGLSKALVDFRKDPPEWFVNRFEGIDSEVTLERPKRQELRRQEPYRQELRRQEAKPKPPQAEEATLPDKATAPKKRTVLKSLKLFSDLLFFMAIALIIVSALTFGAGRNGSPRLILGYSCFNVLTTSMQSEIPKGSFVLVKSTDEANIKQGDVITYMRDAEASVTHKVVAVYEDYNGSGRRGFQTQGVNNANPDSDIVSASNVVGVVVAHIPAVGAVIAAIGSNIYFVFIIFGLFMVLSFALRSVFGKRKASGNDEEKAIA